MRSILREAADKMAAPVLDGPQHAPSPIRGLSRVRMEGWQKGVVGVAYRQVCLTVVGLLMEGHMSSHFRLSGWVAWVDPGSSHQLEEGREGGRDGSQGG
jgi:hypothetical protein